MSVQHHVFEISLLLKCIQKMHWKYTVPHMISKHLVCFFIFCFALFDAELQSYSKWTLIKVIYIKNLKLLLLLIETIALSEALICLLYWASQNSCFLEFIPAQGKTVERSCAHSEKCPFRLHSQRLHSQMHQFSDY